MTTLAAWVVALLCGGVAVFHIAASLGARVGPWTQGGAHPGALPGLNRGFAAVSAGLMVALALAVLSQVGQGPGWPRWSGWVAVGVLAVAVLVNLATPSRRERQLWVPVTLVMLGCALVVMRG
jgi:hypothetical protein